MKKHMKLGIFVLVTAVCFSACGKKNSKDNESSEDLSTEAVTESVQQVDLTKSYRRGRVSGLNYKNDFFGFSCDLDGEWRLYTDEEIDEINQFQAGAATDENVALVLEESYLLDMAAARYDGRGSISIIVQTVQPGDFSEKDYAESGVDAAAESMRQSGYTEVEAKLGTVRFCGRDRVSIDISAVSPPDASAGDAEKGSIYEKQITAINGKYICVLTFKAGSEKEVDDMIGMFR